MKDGKMIHRAYKGNIHSERLTIMQTDFGFEFIHQKFKRTNPSQAERKLNIKPKRNLLDEQVYKFRSLVDQDFSQMPFFDLMKNFNLNPE